MWSSLRALNLVLFSQIKGSHGRQLVAVWVQLGLEVGVVGVDAFFINIVFIVNLLPGLACMLCSDCTRSRR